jgi:hypothetical protein
MLGEAVGSGLDALRGRSGQTAISILGEPPKQESGNSKREADDSKREADNSKREAGNSKREADGSETSMLRWVPERESGKLPLFLIYFGEGSAYALICEDAPGRERTRFFQTCDRNLVEHLALQAQHELYGPGSDRA